MTTRTTVSTGRTKRAAPPSPQPEPSADKTSTRARIRGTKAAAPADSLSLEERQRFVAEAAYFRAERRGFTEGGELDDWLQAEAEIDARFRAS